MLAANFSNLPSWSDMNSLLNGSSWNSYLGNINATIQKNPWNSAQDSVTTFGNLATLAGGGSYCG
jgi:hypothetical protein